MRTNFLVQCPLAFGAVIAVGACSSSTMTSSPPANTDASTMTTDSGEAMDGAATPVDVATPESDGAIAEDTGLAFAPSNVPLTAFPSTAGDVTFSGTTCVVDTDQLSVSCVSPGEDGGLPYTFVTATQSDGSSVAILAVNSLTIASATSTMLRGSVPLIVWAKMAVNIQGSFIADPTFHPTNGGGAVETGSGTGGGPGGGGAGLSGVGGGGGGYCGVGGTGANGQTVISDAGTPAAGGRSYGNATITPLIAGSSGGAPLAVGGGGEGGGGLEITAGVSIIVGSSGAVSVPGYGGNGNGGGGGSGGALILEAPTVTVYGVLAANGGGGAVFSGGGNAQDGQPSAVPAMGQDANSAVGSAGTMINGAHGVATTSATSSGGGAAGRIRINTATGAAVIGPSAVISPDVTTPCTTQGSL